MSISNKNTIQPVITLDGMTKIFQTEEVDTYALHNISLSIMPGEFVSITGPSGCGKSTLLSILGLLDIANSGQYVLDGRDVSDLKMRELAVIRNSDIGFIFQSFNLIADLSIEANVELPLTYRNNIHKAERREMVNHALDLVGMSHRLKHYPSQLSGGQQQRVAVARALAGQPKILLADEPTGNLDSENGKVVMDLLNKLHDSGSTLCMVTHDIKFAQQANRVIYMKDGRVAEAVSGPKSFAEFHTSQLAQTS